MKRAAALSKQREQRWLARGRVGVLFSALTMVASSTLSACTSVGERVPNPTPNAESGAREASDSTASVSEMELDCLPDEVVAGMHSDGPIPTSGGEPTPQEAVKVHIKELEPRISLESIRLLTVRASASGAVVEIVSDRGRRGVVAVVRTGPGWQVAQRRICNGFFESGR